MAMFDTTRFESGLQRFEGKMPDAVKHGLGMAGIELLADCGNIPPTVPKRTGRLRESGSVIVGHTVTTAPTEAPAAGQQHVPGTPNTDPMPEKRGGNWACFVGFNTEYAAKVHNSPGMGFREPDSGPFFLQKKMRERRDKYLAVMGAAFRKKMGT